MYLQICNTPTLTSLASSKYKKSREEIPSVMSRQHFIEIMKQLFADILLSSVIFVHGEALKNITL